MGNRRSRAAQRGGSWLRVHQAREQARQQQAARVLQGSGVLRPPPSPAKLRAMGVAMLAVCLLLGVLGALLGVRFFR